MIRMRIKKRFGKFRELSSNIRRVRGKGSRLYSNQSLHLISHLHVPLSGGDTGVTWGGANKLMVTTA